MSGNSTRKHNLFYMGLLHGKRANSPFVLPLKADGLKYGKDFSESVHRIQKRGRNAIPFHL